MLVLRQRSTKVLLCLEEIAAGRDGRAIAGATGRSSSASWLIYLKNISLNDPNIQTLSNFIKLYHDNIQDWTAVQASWHGTQGISQHIPVALDPKAGGRRCTAHWAAGHLVSAPERSSSVSTGGAAAAATTKWQMFEKAPEMNCLVSKWFTSNIYSNPTCADPNWSFQMGLTNRNQPNLWIHLVVSTTVFLDPRTCRNNIADWRSVSTTSLRASRALRRHPMSEACNMFKIIL